VNKAKNVYFDLGAASLEEKKTNYFYEYEPRK